MVRLRRNDEIKDLTPDEGRTLFNEASQELLGIRGEDFARRWHAGEYRETEDPRIMHLALLLPFVEE